MLGIRTWDCRIVGTDGSTELLVNLYCKIWSDSDFQIQSHQRQATNRVSRPCSLHQILTNCFNKNKNLALLNVLRILLTHRTKQFQFKCNTFQEGECLFGGMKILMNNLVSFNTFSHQIWFTSSSHEIFFLSSMNRVEHTIKIIQKYDSTLIYLVSYLRFQR